MSNSTQTAILLFAMQSLKSEGSWCGETHVQKALFLCQEIVSVPSNFKFVLYKHGPYSFDISEKLQGLIADDLVHVLSRPPYGPSLEVCASASVLISKVDGLPTVGERVHFLSRKLARKGVVELEKLATAVYVNKQNGSATPVNIRAEILNSIKPHVSIDAAKLAFDEVESISREVMSHSFQ